MKVAKGTRTRAAPVDKRDAILDAALSCFVAQGFHGTAVPEVARKAGVATGTIYHYFPSKEALVNALYRKWKEAAGRQIFTAYPPLAPVREQFHAVWQSMLEFARAYPQAFAFLELHHHRSYLDAESLAMEHRLKDFAAAMLTQAQARGEVKAGSTTLLMEMVFGAFNGMMAAHWDGRIELSDEVSAVAERSGWDIIAAHSDDQDTP